MYCITLITSLLLVVSTSSASPAIEARQGIGPHGIPMGGPAPFNAGQQAAAQQAAQQAAQAAQQASITSAASVSSQLAVEASAASVASIASVTSAAAAAAAAGVAAAQPVEEGGDTVVADINDPNYQAEQAARAQAYISSTSAVAAYNRIAGVDVAGPSTTICATWTVDNSVQTISCGVQNMRWKFNG